MHKGEVVEEGDHYSLMRAQGKYFGLVEQQSLRQVEEDEGSDFEKQEVIKMLLPEQSNLDHSNIGRDRCSTIGSLTPSISGKLNGRKDSTDVNLEKENNDENVKTTKVIKKVKS